MSYAANKVTFGFKNVHVAFRKGDEWDTPVALPGGIGISMDPQGSDNNMYADDGVYYTTSSNAGYTGSLEMADFENDTIKSTYAKMLGWEIDDNGAIIEITDGVPEPFALMYEVTGDQKKRRAVFYNCTVSRPSVSDTTKTDSSDPATRTVNLTAVNQDFDGKMVARAVIEPSEENQGVYDTFYTSVYTPNKAVA